MKYLKRFESKDNSFDYSRYDDLNYIKKYIENGGDLNKIDDHHEPFIINAAENHNIPLLEFLIENGADINAVNSYGNTILHRLDYYYNNNKIIDIAIQAGINWFIKNHIGKTFLEILESSSLKLEYKYIIETYPEKYQEYLKWKKTKEFNL